MERVGVPYCPECGGTLIYMSAVKMYICQSCGVSFTGQELLEVRERMIFNPESEEEKREKKRREYLKWWFRSKKEKSRM